MATQAGLARSFYGWLYKVERDLKRDRGAAPILSKLPTVRPTTLSELAPLSVSVYGALVGTKHEERAAYWKGIFEGIQRDGWHPDATVGSHSGGETE